VYSGANSSSADGQTTIGVAIWSSGRVSRNDAPWLNDRKPSSITPVANSSSRFSGVHPFESSSKSSNSAADSAGGSVVTGATVLGGSVTGGSVVGGVVSATVVVAASVVVAA
jgi:hypothetical protein